jgi:hypothetical protein
MAFHSTYSPNFDSLVTVGAATPSTAIGANTLAVWANFNSLATDGELIEINAVSGSGGNGAFDSAILYSLASAKIEFTQRSSTQNRDFVATFTIATGTWYHFALVWDGTNLTGYANGAVIGTNTTGALTGTRGNWGNLQLGPATAELQDGVFFAAALTIDEIAQLYRARCPDRRNNLIGHYPCYPGSNRGLDYSGNGNNFGNQGTPIDSTVTPPSVGWGVGRSRIILPNSSGITIVGAGLVNVTGAAAMSSGASAAGAGLVNVTGSAAMLVAKSAAGLVNVTGAAAMASTAPLAAAGLVNVTGAAVVTGNTNFSIAAVGTTQVSGAAVETKTVAPLVAAGLTQTTGQALEGGAALLSPAGLTFVTGSAVVSSSAPAGVANNVHLWRRNRRGR